MGQRRKSRESAFLALFSQYFTRYDGESCLEKFAELRGRINAADEPDFPPPHETDVPPHEDELALALVRLHDEHREAVEKVIRETLQGWTLERLSPTVAALLRLGATELLYVDEIPAKVSINEYVDIAKRYAEDEAPSLVNAVLDRIHKTSKK